MHAGISAIERLTSTRGVSKEYFESTPAFLAGGWTHVPKEKRRSKVSPRAIKVVYGSRCEDQPGFHRVIPYHDNGVEIEVFPTIITDRFIQEGDTDIFPWRRKARPYEPPVETAGKDEMAQAAKHKEVEEYEPEEVISKGKNDEGKIVYELSWKGYDDTTFHHIEDLGGCWKLVENFEVLAEPVDNTHCVGAVVEYKYDDWIADDAEAAEAAKQRKEWYDKDQ